MTNTDPAYRREGHLGVALETFEPVVVTATALDDSPEAARGPPSSRTRSSRARRPCWTAPPSTPHAGPRAGCPANLILTRDGADRMPALEPIRDRFGWSWGCFVEMPVERGIAQVLGMAPVDAPRSDPAGFGLAAEEAYAAWAHLASEALDGYQALYVHIKGPDVPAHDGRAEDKRDVIAAIDRAFFGELLPRIDLGRSVVGVLADHATSCVRKAHTADPVPLLLSGGPFTTDGTPSYGERACARGSLGEQRGVDVLPLVKEALR